MIIEIILALFIGILIGTITGISPGIHINLVSVMLLGISGFLITNFAITPIVLVVFLVSMAIAHTFVDYVPSIFLGAPDEDDNALSILPGHEMLINGEAYSAIVYVLQGCLIGLAIIFIFSPLFFFFLPSIYPYAERIMPLILILIIFFLIYFEKNNRLWAIIIFLLSGILGLTTTVLPLNDSLLPLFTGLFGISSLITSINKRQKIPPQKIKSLKEIKLPKKSYFKSIFASAIASPLCSFLPGMGSGQAAVIGSEITGDIKRQEFLILLGSISTIVTGLSFITLFSIGKARTGIAAAVGEILKLSITDIYLITSVIIISGIFSFFVTLFIARIFSRMVSKINYRLLSIFVIILLILVVFIFSGWLGLVVMLVSTLLGLTCIYSGVRRTHLMGCLIIPSLVFYIL
jgi:putative membrane protein